MKSSSKPIDYTSYIISRREGRVSDKMRDAVEQNLEKLTDRRPKLSQIRVRISQEDSIETVKVRLEAYFLHHPAFVVTRHGERLSSTVDEAFACLERHQRKLKSSRDATRRRIAVA